MATETIRDPRGRMVELTEERWAHIVEHHSDVEAYKRRIMDAIAQPDRWVLASRQGEEWFYLGAVGPSAWLKVVVRYEGERGWIVTAFARRAFP